MKLHLSLSTLQRTNVPIRVLNLFHTTKTASINQVKLLVDHIHHQTPSLAPLSLDFDFSEKRIFNLRKESESILLKFRESLKVPLGESDITHTDLKKIITDESPFDSLPTFHFKGHGLEVGVQYEGTGGVAVIAQFPLGTDWFFRSANYVNGHWTAPQFGNLLPVYDPSRGSIITHVASSTTEDINKAVAAAKEAFKTWSKTSAEERAQYLRAIADDLESKAKYLSKLESLDNGKTLKEAELDVNDVISCFRYYASQIIQFEQKQNEKIDVGDASFNASIRYEPVGVAGLIIPWNYPLLMAAWKVAPCLAAGCTCVLKPSELTPLTALELAASAEKVGLPPGVLNIVNGLGLNAGSPLSSHPDVEKIAFTGSVPTGSKIAAASAPLIKKLSLELGGKSPAIVFPDADLDQVVDWITVGIFFNQGQVCSATSRLLVHESIEKVLLEKLKKVAESIPLGSGLDGKSLMGPLVSRGQYEKVINYIQSGNDHAQLVTGGLPDQLKQQLPEELREGYFIPPTIFRNVEPYTRIWQEEIFGPVLVVKTFATEQQALLLANDSIYGLAGAVFTKDKITAERVAKELKAGIVWVNCSQPTFVQLPWGGMKQSGVGRELGPWGLLNYLETKQVCEWVNPDTKGWAWFTSNL